MTATWPAGPPKVCRLIANQARTAVRKGTTVCPCGLAGGSAAEGAGVDGSGPGWASRVIPAPLGNGWSGRFAAEQQPAAVVLVEAVEDRAGDGEGVLVGAGHRQPAQHHV